MKSHAVVGLRKCHTHNRYIIQCRSLGLDCRGETPDEVGKRFKRLGIKTEPVKVDFIHV